MFKKFIVPVVFMMGILTADGLAAAPKQAKYDLGDILFCGLAQTNDLQLASSLRADNERLRNCLDGLGDTIAVKYYAGLRDVGLLGVYVWTEGQESRCCLVSLFAESGDFCEERYRYAMFQNVGEGKLSLMSSNTITLSACWERLNLKEGL